MPIPNTLDTADQTPSHPRYEAYKDSGVEWLGEIPESWQATRLRFLLDTSPSKGEAKSKDPETEVSFVPMESVAEGGGLDLSETRPLENVVDGYTYFRDGDVLVAKITPCFENKKGALASDLTNGIGFGTTELHVLRPGPHLDSRFLFYSTMSHPFRKIGESTMYGAGGQKRVSDDFIQNLRWPTPSLSEQRAIAAYLDRETECINTLVAKKERLIELLEEKRTALISHTITKGLDENAEMKDSGVEWIGAIPTGWETAKLKYVCTQVKDGLHHTPSKVQSNEGIPFISTQHVRDRKIDIENATYISKEDYEAGHPSVAPEPGDVLITLVGSIGFAAILPQEIYPISATRHVGYVRPGNKLLAEYLCHYTESESFERFLGLETSQVAQPSIYLTSLANHIIPLPPVEEQRRIVKRLDTQLSQFEALIQRVRDGIARLKEYRTALISAAVTGQIDVRGEI